MAKEQQQPHMGAAMLEIIKRTPFLMEEVATAIGVTRRTLYLWFNKPILEAYMVDMVSAAIGVDMRATRPGVFPPTWEIIMRRNAPDNLPDSKKVEYWKSRYDEVYAELREIKEAMSKFQK